MPRCKLTIEYDGTPYAGWQRQDGVASVQQSIEEAIARFYNLSERVPIQCAGRTDAGVHAIGQVAHVDLPEHRPEYSIEQGISQHLGDEPIVIRKAEWVEDDFNARFHAKKRYYRYIISNRRARLALDVKRKWQVGEALDAEKMHEAAQLLTGTHDFSSFRDSQCQSKSPIKSIDAIRVSRQGDEIITDLEAISFLHHQVRIIMGSLRRIGNGKWNITDLENALAAKSRAAAGETAPPYGLYFMKVDY
jgi:tRNA pseudouridine38-40 synthase